MRVNNELVHPCVDQVIERKSDQRFLKNRYQRLWQVVRQRSQPFAETCGQDKCLGDCAHEEELVSLPPTLKLRRGRRLHSELRTDCRPLATSNRAYAYRSR